MSYNHKKAHETVAKSLREFGYPDVTAAQRFCQLS